MSSINVGAFNGNGMRFKTKKGLAEALSTGPGSVEFDPTSLFGSQEFITGDNIPAGVKLSVVGPDPYTSRKWYATVEVKAGKVKVS